MKETPIVKVEEHLKIVVNEKTIFGNIESIVTKTVFRQRIK